MKRKNKFLSINDAIELIPASSSIMVGGFGLRGYPEELVEALVEKNVKDLTVISNDLGSPGQGLGRLLTNNQVRAVVGNYYNWNPEVADAYNQGRIKVTLIPQGTFAEAMRAAGAGIPAFYTPTAVGTDLAKDKEVREFDGKRYLLEKALSADIALIKAAKADQLGNLVYYKTARNFNPLMAMAANLTIVQVDEIVPLGALDPETIHTPHIYVDVIVKRGEKNAVR